MNVRAYLPSATFATTLGALLASGTLIFFAYALTHERPSSATLGSTDLGAGETTASWQSAFSDSTAYAQAQTLQTQAEQLVAAAKTDNLTESVARSLLINTTAAQGQGLGSDAPTQAKIVSDALAQIPTGQTGISAYNTSNIQTVADSEEAFRTYGNKLAEAIANHPDASYGNTMLAVSVAVDNSSAASLGKLSSIGAEYRALAGDVTAIPTPNSLLSATLQIANNYTSMAGACVKMQSVIADPLNGLVGIQSYNALSQANIQAYAQVATVLKNKKVQFTENDPGFIWSQFLAAANEANKQAQAAAKSTTQ